MASEKQIAANRTNAQKSTGPRTPEGKAVVSLNSLTHGLRSSRVVLPGDDEAEFQQLCADLHAEWQPQTPTETHLLQRMTVALWKLDRLEHLEWACYLECSLQYTTEDGFAIDSNNEIVSNILPEEFRVRDMIDRVSHHQARLERSYDKALSQLQQLRKARAALQPAVSAITQTEPVTETQPSASTLNKPELIMHPTMPVEPDAAVARREPAVLPPQPVAS